MSAKGMVLGAPVVVEVTNAVLVATAVGETDVFDSVGGATLVAAETSSTGASKVVVNEARLSLVVMRT